MLFATAEGLTFLSQKLLSDENNHTGFHEVFAEADRHEAQRLNLADLGIKSMGNDLKVKKIYRDSHDNIWFATENTVFSYPLKKLKRLVAK